MTRIIIIITIIVNLGLAFVQLSLTSMRSGDGAELIQIQTQTARIALENWRMQQTIATKASLTYIASQVADSDLTYTKAQFAPTLTVARGVSIP